MNKRIIVIHIVAALLLLIPAGYLHNEYNRIESEFNKEEPIYGFILQIDPSANFSLNNFLITYDFGKPGGNMTFRVSEGTIPSSFGARLPSELTITEVEFVNKSGYTLMEGKDYLRTPFGRKTNEYALRGIELWNFSQSIDGSDVTIKFEGELIPNANFLVMVEVTEVIPSGFSDGFFSFITVNYDCPFTDDCLSSYRDVYKLKKLKRNSFVVKRNDDESIIDLTRASFHLMFDSDKAAIRQKEELNQWRFLLFGIIIAVVVEGLIVSLITKGDFLEEDKEELMNFTIRELREIVKKEKLGVKARKKDELVLRIIKARKKLSS